MKTKFNIELYGQKIPISLNIPDEVVEGTINDIRNESPDITPEELEEEFKCSFESQLIDEVNDIEFENLVIIK